MHSDKNRITFWVDGIKNNTEKVQMKKNLEKIDGVHEIAIDRTENIISIDYFEPATEETLKNHIVSTGHHVNKIEEW